MEEYSYKNKKYYFSDGVWLTSNFLAVPTELQSELNRQLIDKVDFSKKSVSELLAIIDKSRIEQSNTQLAGKLLKIALQKADDRERMMVLPRATSNLRMIGHPQEAIDLAQEYMSRYGLGVASAPLYTSMGAAYADLDNLTVARKYADKAYAAGGKGDSELNALYQRLECLENPADTPYDRQMKKEDHFASHPKTFSSKNTVSIRLVTAETKDSVSSEKMEINLKDTPCNTGKYAESEEEFLNRITREYIHILSGEEDVKTRFNTLLARVMEDSKRISYVSEPETGKKDSGSSFLDEPGKTAEERTTKENNNPLTPEGRELFEILRNVRLALAREEKQPPFYIFSDKTLTEMCINLPQTREEMLGIKGVGLAKLDKYAGPFIREITEFVAVHPDVKTSGYS